MRVHRITNIKTHSSLRLFLWICVSIAIAAMLFGFCGPVESVQRLGKPIAILVAFLVLAIIALAIFLSIRMGLARAQANLSFEVDQNRIISRRPDRPDLQILFSEITELFQRSEGLIVRSHDHSIFIPADVDGLKEIQTELMRYAPMKKAPVSPFLPWITLMAPLPILAVAFFSQSPIVTYLSGALGMGIFAYSNWQIVLAIPKARRWFAAAYFGLAWSALIWFAALKMHWFK
jgi:hypothetical protein